MPTDLATMMPEQPFRPGRPLPDLTRYGLECPEYEQARERFLELKRHRDEASAHEDRLRKEYERQANMFASDAVKATDSASEDGFLRSALRKPLDAAKKRIRRLEGELEESWLTLQGLNTALNKAYAQAHQVLRWHQEELSLQLAEVIRRETARARGELEGVMNKLQHQSEAYNELLRLTNASDPTQVATPNPWGLPQLSPVNEAYQTVSQAVGKSAVAQSVLASALQARADGAALEQMAMGESAGPHVDAARATQTADELERQALAALAAAEEGSP